MPLAAGSRFGNFDLMALLGVGGMGAVYRARDRKLNRDVALKVLPEEFALDADRRARFEREAQVLASLSHPNIAVIHGVEEASDGDASDAGPRRALVLELVEGPTLADELAQGALPLDRALHIARQIADALEGAHERGVVHRDLKPANVKVRPDGIVKVLDFGLAKALDPLPAHASGQPPPTLVSPALTVAGMIFGTAAYMSPEQARGRAADERSDIWAFGCVLYEMLTGKRAFPGDEVSDTMAAILRAEPDWSALPAGLPPAVRRLLRRCLEKDRARRLRAIGDARLELEAGAADDAQPAAPRPAVAARAAWLGAIVAAAVVGFAAARWNAREPPPLPEYRLDVTTPETSTPASFAISPDGRSIVYTADGPRGEQLWVRDLASSVARPLPGTENARLPFWAPDSQTIGFFSLNALQYIDADGGRAETLAPAVTPAGGSWREDNTIFYVPNDSSGVVRVPAGGGESARVTGVDSSPVPNRFPQALPGGRHFLVFIATEDASSGVYVADESGEMRRVVAADAAAVFGAGHLWFIQQGTLFAQRFDPTTHELSGPMLRIADDVGADLAVPAVSVSADGTVAYRAGTRHLQRQLVWFDRAGARLSVVGDPDTSVANPSLSTDERRLLVQRTLQYNVDIWSFDLERNLADRLTTRLGIDSMPVWAADGRRFAYNSVEPTIARTLAIQHVDGSVADEGIIPFVETIRIATDWSHDGRYLIGKQTPVVGAGIWDLWAFPFDDGAEVQQLTATPYDERDAQFSPDGEWIAFESNESGTPEIYLQPFGRAGAKRRVSTAGGREVRWRRDGVELFYLSLDGTLMAVPMQLANGQWNIGTSAPLFNLRLPPTTAISRQSYVVNRDGQRFLAVIAADVPTPPITVLLNWQPAVQ